MNGLFVSRENSNSNKVFPLEKMTNSGFASGGKEVKEKTQSIVRALKSEYDIQILNLRYSLEGILNFSSSNSHHLPIKIHGKWNKPRKSCSIYNSFAIFHTSSQVKGFWYYSLKCDFTTHTVDDKLFWSESGSWDDSSFS